ncbi:AAA family ATPase [Caulobacter sp. UC70_42]|uniref:AAA family ATPase n=1 Tax=Caulobacter sp. UC70_42 TaxID=3374551 RepID=UPI003757B43B
MKISLLKSDFSLQVSDESISWVTKNIDDVELYRNHLEISSKDKDKCKTDYHFDPEKFFGRREFFSEEFVKQLLKEIGKNFNDPMKNAFKMAREGHSLFKWATPAVIPELVGVERAFTFGRSFNISPDKVRAPEDIASKNEMMADGSGTISQLYKVKPTDGRGKRKSDSKTSKSQYEKVIENFKQLNEEISDLEIRPDIRTGKLDCKATIGSGPKSIKLPMISLSDGSAKWLAILTIVRLFKQSYCIEEPENYLHPRAQRVFIEVLRGLVDENNSRYFLITTHSETVVGASKVPELRICDYGRGTTHIRSVENPSAVDEAIADTGFGLGFFYANDRL